MTLKKYSDMKWNSGGRLIVSGSFRPAAAGAPTNMKGGGYTVVRTSAGLYTVTLDDYPDLDVESLFVDVGTDAAVANVHANAKEVAVDSSTDKAIQIEVYRGSQGSKGTIQLPIDGSQEDDGTALADFASADTEIPGLAGVAETAGIRWNNKATQKPLHLSFVWPNDVDTLVDAALYCAVSKSGATAGDAVKMTATVVNQPAAALYDADTAYGGDTDALVGDATAKTVTVLSVALALADLPATFPCAATAMIQPKDGTLATDDGVLHAAWIEYTRALELVDLAASADNVVNFMAVLRDNSYLQP